MTEDERAHDAQAEPELVIPLDRLPPGFAERIGQDATPATPRAAATAVLLRDAHGGPEILLLRRQRASGFVPGAYVFPGGLVDEADGDPALVALLGDVPRGPDAPYWLAAVREVFEETGVLLARGASSAALADSDVAHWRARLLANEATLLDVLRALDLEPDIGRMVYCSHWITPVAEPRRYDTRFFLAELPAGSTVSIDEREMSDAVWVTAHEALERFRRGTLPMVFPTVKTVQHLAPYGSVDEALLAFRDSDVPAVLPRLVRTRDGVGIVVDDETHDQQRVDSSAEGQDSR